MAWITVIFSLASCNRLLGDTGILQLVSVIQSYVIVAFAFVVLRQAANFGRSLECNQEAVAVVFRPFSASKSGRIAGFVLVSLMTFGYTVMTARDFTARVHKKMQERKQRQDQVAPSGPPPDAQAPPFLHFIPPPTFPEPLNAQTPIPRRVGPYPIRECETGSQLTIVYELQHRGKAYG
jgi:hypothetical protein